MSSERSNLRGRLKARPARIWPWTRHFTLARISLAAVVLSGAILCLAATKTNILLPQSLRPIVSPWMAGPLRFLAFRLRAGELVAIITAMFVFYFISVTTIHRVPVRAVIAAVVILHLFALLAPPLFSTDMFSYQAYGRMFAIYKTNPYLHGPSTISLDPLYPYIGSRWISTPSVYGPAFTLLTGLLAHAPISVFEVTMKLLATVASLGICRLIWLIAKLRGSSPVAGLALYGLNPLTTIYGVGGGHNDMLMVLCMTAGVWMLLKRRDATGGLLVALGAAVKLTGALVAPFAFAAEGPPLRRSRRTRFAGSFVVVLVATLALGVILFGTGLARMPVTLVSVQNIEPWGSIPGVIGEILGTAASTLIGRVLGVACLLLLLWLLRRVWRGELDWIEGAAWLTLAMLAGASTVLPWYQVWALPLVAICTSRALWRSTHILTGVIAFVAIAGYFPGGAFFGI